jgi:AcrR family transcriptional regulator
MTQTRARRAMSARAPAVTNREPLTRERILRAAIELADREGIDGLSMRRLAQELGVEAMSLYHHVASKRDLLGGMLDLVYAEMEPPTSEGDWRAALRRTAISAHHVLLRHPWACQLLTSPSSPSSSRLAWMDGVLGRLRSADFSTELTHHAYHALDSHIVGFTLWVLPYLAIEDEDPDYAQRFLTYEPIAAMPHLLEHIRYHIEDEPPDAGTSEFDFGLDLLLDGLERLRNAGGST